MQFHLMQTIFLNESLLGTVLIEGSLRCESVEDKSNLEKQYRVRVPFKKNYWCLVTN